MLGGGMQREKMIGLQKFNYRTNYGNFGNIKYNYK
jgi:hypothetical protein